jgi:hypothetical protein
LTGNEPDENRQPPLLLGSMLRRCDGLELDRAQALEDEAAAVVESVEDQVTRSVLDRMLKEQLAESQVGRR